MSKKKKKNTASKKTMPIESSQMPKPEMSLDINQIFMTAVQCHQKGQASEAELLYRKILEVKPDHSDALHLLGIIAHNKNNCEQAMELIDNAIRIFPQNPMYYYNKGNVFISQRKFEDAVACYKKAFEIKPDYTEAYNNAGSALKDLGKPEESLLHYRKALELNPNYVEAHYNMGIVLDELRRAEEAAASFRKAIEINPNHAEAYYNMGMALVDLGRTAEAIAAYRKASEIRPDYIEAYNELGIELNNKGRTAESLDCYRKILQIKPNCAEAYNNMGVALRNHGDPEEAVVCYHKVLEIEPNNAVAHSNLLFSLQYTSDHSAEWLFEQHRKWNEIQAKPLEKEILIHLNDPTPGRRLRVGYVSPDFRSHSCAYFIQPLLGAHDKTKVEIFCYSDVQRGDEITQRIKSVADHWFDSTKKSHEVIAEQIRKDRIDILVDLAGHTAKNRLIVFARKPAPIQVTWLGYPDTAGMDVMDYRFTDAVADPPGLTDKYVSETLVRLPGFLCYEPPARTPVVSSLPIYKNHYITFASFNNLTKTTEKVVKVWSQILHRVPRSRLLLKSRQLANESTKERYLEMFLKNGIPAERIITMPRTPTQEGHLDVYSQVDVALDPFPYNGTTTSFEALWMGVPFITLRGERHVSRVGTSILTRFGLTGLIAKDEEDYIARAVWLAGDINQLAGLRGSLRQQMLNSPLCNAKAFAQSVEAAYQKMWEKWCFREDRNRVFSKKYDYTEFQISAADIPRPTILAPPNEFDMNKEFQAAVKYHESGELSKAEEVYRKILSYNPNHPDALHLHGVIAFQIDQHDIAITEIRKAIQINPYNAIYYHNLGSAMSKQGMMDEAVECYRKVLSLQPEYVEAYSNLLLTLQYGSERSREAVFEEHLKWDEMYGKPLLSKILPHTNDSYPGRRLRIGYVSPDFRNHSCAYFLEPLLKAHDRTQVEIFCYAEVQHSDEMTEQIRRLSDHWYSTLEKSHDEVAEQICNDRIDILIDLAGHTAKNRLLVFARKPAPIQISWLGYPDTSGMAVMDYRFSDAVADPEGVTDKYFTEKLIRLPNGFLCYTPPNAAPETAVLPFLNKNHITFGSFNNIIKVNESVVRVWSQILHQVPGSVLLLKSRQFVNASMRQKYVEWFAKNSIPSERVIMQSRIPDKKEHLALYHQVDIALDPFPYNGTTTTCEALWMGVPVITLCGDRHRALVGTSILTRIALIELIASSETDYIAKAVHLAGDIHRLSSLRAGLRGRMQHSPLCDAESFARSVESAYREIWAAWCEKREKGLVFQTPPTKEFNVQKSTFEVPAAPTNPIFQVANAEFPKPAPVAAPPSSSPAPPASEFDNDLRAAVQLHQGGQLDKAEEIYRKVLAVNPNHPDALHLLGVSTHQRGQHGTAVELIRKAISVNPRNPFYYNNMGIALKENGKIEEALFAYRTAAEIKPDYMEAYINLSMTLKEQGRTDELIACYRKMLELKPDYPEVYNSMGIALKAKGELDEAIACYRKVIEIKPDYVEAYINLGNAMKFKGEREQAVVYYSKALEIRSDYPEAYNNMGAALEEQGKLDEAIECYRKAFEIRPDYAEACHNMGNTLKNKGKLEEAIVSYRKSVEIKPNYAEAYNSLGIALKEQGKFDEAVECYRKALELEPKGTGAYYNLGNALGDIGKADEAIACYRKALELKPEYAEAYVNMGNVLKNQGRIDEAIASYRAAMQLRPDYHQAHSNFLFTLHYGGGYAPDWLFEQHRKWDEVYAKPLAEKILTHSNEPTPERRLRVGYVSPDFRSHSCAYFIEPLLRGHDKNQVEIFCYSEVPKPDDVTTRIKELAEHWYETSGKSPDDVAKQISEDCIDILVDLAGHTANNRLLVFARKPVPIQVTWLGYPDTTGLSAIDYRFTDAMADPEGEADKYASEKLMRLPHGFLCYSPLYKSPDVGELPVLKNKYITFASFNNLAKVSEHVVAVWAKIMHYIPGSKFLLKNRRLADDSTQKLYHELFARYGIPSERVIMMPHTPGRNDHLDMYNQVDIALDPFPYNGTTTTFEALWMGVPVLSICGDRHVSRVGASIVKRLGLIGLIAENEENYIDRAIWLAGDLEQLSGLRGTLRQRMMSSSLCNAKIFTESVEAAYREMWKKWCETRIEGSKSKVQSIPTPELQPVSEFKVPTFEFKVPSESFNFPNPEPQPVSEFKVPTFEFKVPNEAFNMPKLEPQAVTEFKVPTFEFSIPNPEPTPELLPVSEFKVQFVEVPGFQTPVPISEVKTPALEPMSVSEFKEVPAVKVSVPLNIEHLLRTAVEHHKVGQLDEAEKGYQKVLEQYPNQPDALHLFGVISHQRGKHEAAIELIQKAIQINPQNGTYYNNLGVTLKERGNLVESIECYGKAIAFNPNYAEAYVNMGMALNDQGKPDEAVSYYQKVLEIHPNYAEAYNHIGLVLKGQGRFDEAMTSYRKALEINPNYADAYISMGNVLKTQGRMDEALAAYRKAIEINPNFAEVYNNMGNAFRDLSKADEAIAYYRKSVEIKPDFAEAYSNMGVALNDQGKVKEAVECYNKALAIKPAYHQARSNMLFTLQHSPDYSPEWMFEQHREWDKFHAKPIAKEILPHNNERKPGKRLRVGYVSPDFRRHSCAYFLEPLLKAHDRTQVEIFCYSEVQRPDDVTERIRQFSDHWYSTVGKRHDALAAQIRNDGIDILVDLAGHTENNRLLVFACKPAPIQVTWLGYPDTTGLEVIDYRFTDAVADPEGEADRYASETLIRLSEGFHCYSPIYDAPPTAEPPFSKAGYITFGSFNNMSKVSENVVALWAKILQQTPRSRLFLKSRQASDPSTLSRYLNLFSENGIASERVIISPRVMSREEHLSLYNRIDVGLDPFPYNGTTTTFEALWMGVPVITLCGNRHVARVGASILTRLGLTDLIAENENDYISKAVRLAGNKHQLMELRGSLRGRIQQSPLCDAEGFARAVESAYRKMWTNWCERGNLKLDIRTSSPLSNFQIPISDFQADFQFNIEAALKEAVQYHQNGELDKAEKFYQKILSLEPNHADALHLLGVIASQQGNYDHAVNLIGRAIRIRPQMEMYYNNMGNAFKEKGSLDEAILYYKKAVEIKSDFLEPYHNMGVVLKDQGKFEEAATCYQKALVINPNFAEIYNEIGNVRKEQGRVDEAIAAYRKAIELKLEYAIAYNNLGISLQDQGKIEESLVCYRKALETNPNFPEAYNNMGNALKEPGLLNEAIACYKKAVEIRPSYTKAHSNFLNILQYYSPPMSRDELYALHCKWDEIHAKPLEKEILPLANDPNPERCLRIGYVSPDFCRHSCAYFIEPLFRGHDRTQVEIFCYAEVHLSDDITEQIRRLSDHWYSTVGKTSAEVAEQIRRDKIDILVDLAGHFAKNRLLVFARKPAPIQVTWLGYPDTTGMAVMDYRFTDMIADPEGMSENYIREKLVRLPNGFLCYSPIYPAPEIAELPMLKTHHPTFGSFNNLSKVTEHTVSVWSQVLQQVPRSRILLKSRQLADESTQHRYLEMFGKYGITSERIRLMPRFPSRDEHLVLYHQIDIGLDPFPYNGTATTCEALWMGVPVVTLRGDRHVSSVGSSILTQIGLTDLIADTEYDYIAKAVRLANDTGRLMGLRASLRHQMQMSPLCNASAFAQSVEAAYREMWRKFNSENGKVKLETQIPNFQVNIEKELNQGVALHQAGEFDKAKEIYKKILQVDPNQPDALHLLGVIAHQTGKNDEAVSLIARAIQINPQNPLYYSNIGAALKNCGRVDEAIVSYKKAVEINPNYPEAYSNLGNALKHQGKIDEAVVCYKRAVEINPNYAEAYNNMGNALKTCGRIEESLAAYNKAIEINPKYAEAYYNMGGTVKMLNRLEESLECYKKAVEINPNYAEAYNNMGVVYKFMGKSEESVECYKKAIEINPKHAEAYNNLGIAMNNQGRAGEAIDCYSKAMAHKENYAEAHNNMGYAMNDQGRLREAAEYYRKAVEMKPDYNQAHSNLLFTLQYGSGHSPEWLFEQHRLWHEKHAAPLASEIKAHSNEQKLEKRLRVGYLSPDFRGHSCAYFLEPLFRAHDKTQVEIFCYAEVQNADPVTARFRQLSDHWYDTIGKSDQEVAEQIRNDGIDILVDLAGHTANNRLSVFARKPAPIQISWLGYPDTTGMNTIDYRLSDFVADPEGMSDKYFTETLMRLPNGFLCYSPLFQTPEVSELPFLKSGKITFGSFNNLTKVNEEVIAAWSRILLQVPGSRLLLKSRQLIDEPTRQRYYGLFSNNDVASERVTMIPRTPSQAEHLAVYHQVDIGLDPFPYNGTTTSCEALWMGVPVITFCGKRHVSRVTASILTRIGLTALIAETEGDYIAKAVHLAGDIEYLKSLRTSIRQRMLNSPLCNPLLFAKSVEAAYREMWTAWCSGRNLKSEIANRISLAAQKTTEDKQASITLQTAIQLHKVGQIGKAEEAYKRVLEAEPMNAEALHYLGIIAHQSGRNDEAVNLIRKAIDIDPQNTIYHNNIGAALNHLGRKKEAVESYRKAVELNPNYVEAYYNLGNALLGYGKPDEMIAAYRRVLELNPNYVDVYNNLGNALNEQGKSDEALLCYQKALELNPNYAEAYNNMGLMLYNQGKTEASIECYRKSLELKLDYAEAHNNLGNSLHKQDKIDEAIACYKKAAEIKPDYADTYYNMGNALNNQGRTQEAIDAYRKALSLNPKNFEAYNNMANAFKDQGNLDEASEYYRKAMEIKPDYHQAHSNLLFSFHYRSKHSPEYIFEQHCFWDQTHAKPLAPEILTHSNETSLERRLRVGYVSPDFRVHSCAYFLEPLLREHDKKKVEVFCYAEVDKPDQVTMQLKSLADHWYDTVGKNEEEIARQIREDRIDILVDLAGHTANNRLLVFARKPAPVQVTWLGYPDTTGMRVMDYRFTDAIADPEGATEQYFTETLVRLPKGFLCYTPPPTAPAVGPLPSKKINQITFGSFNNLTKVTESVVKVWAQILHRVPRSRILLKNRQLADSKTRGYYYEMFSAKGIPKERVAMFARIPSKEGHLDLYNKIDIALDSFPYNGTTTTCEALWMGVPVVTLCGKRHVERVGASILTQIVMSELITGTEEAYIARAVQLAGNPIQLTGLRSSMRQFMLNSSLCDGKAFASAVETAYREMWRKWITDCKQEIRISDSALSSPISHTPMSASVNQVREINQSSPKLPITSGSPEAIHYNNMAASLKNQGKLDEALACYQKAVAIDPNFIGAYYNMGNTLIAQNKSEEAVAVYRKILEITPNFAEVCNNMGVALKNLNRTEESIASYKKAIEINPNYAEAYNNMGNALKSQNKADAAIDCYKKAMAINPKYIEACYNMGNTLNGQGKTEESLACYRKVLEINPNHPETYNNMGNIFKNKGKADEAIRCYQEALRVSPRNVEAYYNMGNTLNEQGKSEEAVAAYQKALEINPNYAEAHNNMGAAMRNLGKLEETIECYKGAIRVIPNYAEAYNNMGLTYYDLGRLEEGEECCRKALAIKPTYTEAYNNLGGILKDQGRVEEAVACYQEALKLNPDYAEVYNNMGNAIKDLGKLKEAMECYRKAITMKPEYYKAHSNLLFALQYASENSAEAIFEQHSVWDEIHAKPLSKEILAHTNDRTPNRRLRIGYVSPDFRKHSCAYFLEPLLHSHDRNQVEIFCYSEVQKPDEMTERAKALSDRWYNTLGKSDAAIAEKIRKDQIDILVDLAGHTANNRLLVFARKPAPIQVTWLGYPDTSGLSSIDYRFTDDIADPEGEADRYASETLVRLPNGFHCYSPLYVTPDAGDPPCLKNGQMTFVSFNNLTKVTEHTVAVWAQILHQVPGSRILLKSRQLANDSTRQIYIEMFSKNGIHSERIIMMPRTPTQKEHLESYHQADIALDPFPYNGTTTSFEALWMGIPFVNLRGNRHVGRVGTSILSHIGLSELIAETEKDYIAKAVQLAKDIQRLRELRASVRHRLENSPLCDEAGFAKSVESAYREMWITWCSGGDPKTRKLKSDIGKANLGSQESRVKSQHITHPSFNIDSAMNKALQYHQSGKLDEAEQIYKEILAANPNHADALHYLGFIAHQTDKHELAVDLMRKAVQLSPQNAIFYNNMGVALNDQGKIKEAIAAYRKAVEIRPDYAEAHNNMGNLLNDQGGLNEAIACYRKALEIKPNYAEAYNNMGVALKDQGRLDEAIACLRKMSEFDPNNAEVYNNMGNVFKEQGDLKAATNCYKKAMKIKPDYDKAHSNMLLSLQYDSEHTPEWLYEEHRKWNETYAKPLVKDIQPHSNDRMPDRRLRVGYVSPDFRRHSCAYVIEALLRAHDRTQVEIFCYADVQRSDNMTQQIKNLADHWQSVLGKSHGAVAEQIRKDRIDVLVDLAGHTANNRLLVFARKPAPLQLTWLGYPDTTGLDTMDYRLTDAVGDPEGLADKYASEKLIRLSKGFLCYSPPPTAPEIQDLPALRSGQITFGSFNNLTKVTEKVAALWSKILLQIPGSHLLLKSRQLANASTRDRYMEMFLKNGVPAERITMMPHTPSLEGHLAVYHQVDIALDPFPYNGTITCFEALWMGVPVLTLCGGRHVSRVAASILTRLGLSEFIATNENDYISKVVRMAENIERLREVRRSLRGKMQSSPLCDAPGFARSLEAVYREIWMKWCGWKPEPKRQEIKANRQEPMAHHQKQLTQAIQHHKAGQLDKAEKIYKKILGEDSNHADALYYIGLMSHQTGKYDIAADFIHKALQSNPQNAVYYNTLGAALKAMRKFDDAVDCYKKSLEINPNYAEAYYNMGNALNVGGRKEEAVAAYRKVLEINPNNPEAYNNMGAALKDLDRFDEAIDCYKKALKIRPQYSESYNNMGAALKGQGKLDEALECYRKAIEISPNNAEAHYNMGNVLKNMGKLTDAIDCYKKAIEINPNNSEVYGNLGNALKDQGRLDEAMMSCKKALEINPNYAEARNSLGVVLNEQGKIEEAASYYRSAVAAKPDYPEAHNNIGNALKDQGRLGEAIDFYKKALQIRPDYYQAHSNLLFTYQYGDHRDFGSDYSPKWVFEQHRLWNETHAKPLITEILPHHNDSKSERRLRIGYVSPDFHRHSCAYFIMPLFRAHDKTKVEIFCYADMKTPDEITQELRSLADRWYPTMGKSHAEVAKQIRADRIDILVDLAGHSANDHLMIFARKPAPVQVTWLGYPDTTGMDVMDYRFTDAEADPEGVERYFSEKLVRLPGGFLCYTPLSSTPDVSESPLLKSSEIIFASFNNSSKVTRNVISVWSQILKQIPNSYLVVKSKQLTDESTRKRYHEMFLQNGVSAERVKIMSRLSSRQEHLDLYSQVDIALDPFPYNGTTTTCEALWMGVPVLTLRGERHVGRVGTSILTRLGLTDLIAETEADYIAKAVQLAGNTNRLRELRTSLRGRMQSSLLCDAKAFAQSVEAAYCEMWARYLNPEKSKKNENKARDVSPSPCPLPGGERGNEDVSNDAEAHYNKGNLLRDQGKTDEAIACYQKALEINPNYAEAYNNMGNMLRDQGRIREAIESYTKAIQINPRYVQAYNNMGIALEDQSRVEDAILCYREALKIAPDYEQAYSNLVPQLQQICDWREYKEFTRKFDELTDAALRSGKRAVEDPFTSLTRHDDPARNFAVAKSWIRDIVKPLAGLNMNFSFEQRKSKTKITLGYISKDFRNHPVAHLMLALFGLHSRDEFEVFCYSYGTDEDSEYRERIKQDADKFVDIHHLGYADAAKRIYADKVDILIDLMGFTGGSRLGIPALRLAPIQATYLGFPGTVGADLFDYIITDRIVTPESHSAYYMEKFVYMPDCFQINDNTQMISDKDWRNADAGLPEKGFVFCSFNQPYKIEPVMFEVWMSILRQVPDSVLWLSKSSETVQRNLRHAAQSSGIAPERLIFAEKLPSKADHLARQRLAGIALDTRIYNGHTTTSDALWSGVPVITLQGGHYASRASSSILNAVGLPELIARSLNEYEYLAVRLATHPADLQEIRLKLAKYRVTKPLFNTLRFVRNLEKAYSEMWKRFAKGDKPAHIEV